MVEESLVCSLCGSRGYIQLHHISYDPPVTQPLCVDCHIKVHGHGVGPKPGAGRTNERVEEGMVISRRRILPVGGSLGVTFSKRWLDIQRWLGREVKELVSIGDDVIILVRPEDEEVAVKLLRQFEMERRRGEARRG
ncbi:MAG: hypothetical protein QXD04_04360 [Candidatus Bathyarchaeia archaeon]